MSWGVRDDPGAFLLTFDGGARARGGFRCAGGAAVLWSLSGATWTPQHAHIVALPTDTWSDAGEVWGLRSALVLAASLPRGCSVYIIGDNDSVIKFAAQTSRLRNPLHEHLISTTLVSLTAAGTFPSFHAVRRKFNKVADFFATQGVFKALELRSNDYFDNYEWDLYAPFSFTLP